MAWECLFSHWPLRSPLSLLPRLVTPALKAPLCSCVGKTLATLCRASPASACWAPASAQCPVWGGEDIWTRWPRRHLDQSSIRSLPFCISSGPVVGWGTLRHFYKLSCSGPLEQSRRASWAALLDICQQLHWGKCVSISWHPLARAAPLHPPRSSQHWAPAV